METARIFHGGRAGKGAVGFPSPTDRIVDPSTGAILLFGTNSGGPELHITAVAGQNFFADQDFMLFTDRDIYISANQEVEIDAGEDIYLFAQTTFDAYSIDDLTLTSDSEIDIVSNGNGINITATAAYPAGQLNETGSVFNISGTDATHQNMLLAISGRIAIPVIKSGATQVASGAAATELWHCTTDHTIRIGI